MINLGKIRARVDYNPNTGLFTWKTNVGRTRAGQVAGSIDAYGYVDITVCSERWKGHRLAWLMHYGKLPIGDVDHINGNRLDNRIENLREASRAENLRNMKVSGKGLSKYKGVSRSNNSWTAQLTINNKKKHIGCYKSEEEAALAYNIEAEKVYGKFAKFNDVFSDTSLKALEREYATR